MSIGGTLVVMVTAATLVSPTSLLISDVPGFSLSGEPAVDLPFQDYSARRSTEISHLEPDSEEAAGLVATIQVWSDGAERIVVEIVRAIDESSATTFVDQSAAQAIAEGLLATDPPFVGAWSYSGGLDGDWTNLVSWNQGPYAVTLTHRSPDERPRDLVDGLAVRQAEIVLTATGATVDEDAAISEEAPGPPTEPGDRAESGGSSVGQTAVWLVLAAVLAVALIVRRRVRPTRSDDTTLVEP